MDNQQVKFASLEWLGGFIDGEGCFGFTRVNRDRLSIVRYYPYFKICGTSPVSFTHCFYLFKTHQVPIHIYGYKPDNPKWNEHWTIEMNGFKRMKQFCEFIRPYVFLKRDDVDTISQVISLRESHSSKDAYTSDEMCLINKLRNRR